MCVCLNRNWRFARGGELHQYRSFSGQDTRKRWKRKPPGRPAPQPHTKVQVGMGWGWQGLNLAYVGVVMIRLTVNKIYLSSTNSSQELLWSIWCALAYVILRTRLWRWYCFHLERTVQTEVQKDSSIWPGLPGMEVGELDFQPRQPDSRTSSQPLGKNAFSRM